MTSNVVRISRNEGIMFRVGDCVAVGFGADVMKVTIAASLCCDNTSMHDIHILPKCALTIDLLLERYLT